MRLRVLYVEDAGERATVAGRDVARVVPLGVWPWEDRRRTGWPPWPQLYALGVRIAARIFAAEEWTCVAINPAPFAAAIVAYYRHMVGDLFDEGIGAVITMRRRPLGPQREDA
jgi:hypothetical protein